MSWILMLWPWLLNSALISSLFLGPAVAAAWGLRHPVERLFVAKLALLACFVAPLLQSLPGLTPWQFALSATHPTENVSVPAAAKAFADARPESLQLGPSTQPLTAADARDVRPSERPSPATARWTLPSIPWQELACLVYVVAVSVFALRWLVGLLQLALFCRRTQMAPEWAKQLLLEIAGPSARGAEVRCSRGLAVPITFSWRHPVIVIPQSLLRPEHEESLRAGLAHEWSHVARRDIWWWHLATLAQIVICHQPLAWPLRRQLRLDQDHLADDLAAREVGAEIYAEQLLRAAKNRDSLPLGAALGLNGTRTNLSRRVTMMLDHRQPFHQRSRAASMTAASIACCGLLVIATLVVVSRPSAAIAQAESSAEKASPSASAKDETPTGDFLNFRGRVVERDTKLPLEGATVTVRRSALTSNENRVLEETEHKTDAKGEYELRITPEQAAEWSLYVELDVKHPTHAPRSGFGYSYDMLRKNARLGERPFFEDVALDPGEAVTGQVLSPEGKPVANAPVSTCSHYAGAERHEFGSWTDTTTDKDGRFTVVIASPGDAVLWLIPEAFSPETHILDRRGDLGTFTMRAGTRISGRVVDEAGKPMIGVPLEADLAINVLDVGKMSVANRIRRQTKSGPDGDFEFAPLPPGKYTVKAVPSEDGSEHDRKQAPLPAVFSSAEIELVSGTEPAPLEVRAIPSVVVEGQFYDSKGQPRRGHAPFLAGELNGNRFHAEASSEDGHVVVLAPKGLTNAELRLMTNEHSVLRFRLDKNSALSNQEAIKLGTLDQDVRGIEIVRYTAPILVVGAAAEDGRPIEDFKPRLSYVTKDNPKDPKSRWISGVKGDVLFRKQEDGRWRSSGMLPDEEVTVHVEADGYEPHEQLMRFTEGSETELKATLKKKPAGSAEGR